jgi:hypothetical protein
MAAATLSIDVAVKGDSVSLSLAGAAVSIPAATLADLWIQRLRSAEVLPAQTFPNIGEVWPDQGGIYAGIVRGDSGQPDYHLVVATEDFGECKWQAAMDRAKGILGGEYTLPKRKEQAVLFGNVPELFEKAWYWSCEQLESNADYAWCQGFVYGYQLSTRKGGKLRARAVRRLTI